MRHIRCACSNANYSSESGSFQDNMRESGVLVRNVVLAGGEVRLVVPKLHGKSTELLKFSGWSSCGATYGSSVSS